MYGLIGKIVAVSGRRGALVDLLMEATLEMPGCLQFIIATDEHEADALWVTEVWDSEASHNASLSLPAVQAALEKARPLIDRFAERAVTRPVGGHGLP